MILDAQHFSQLRGFRSLDQGRDRHCRSGRRGARQVDPETATAAHTTAKAHLTVHQTGQLAAQHQPDTGAWNARILPSQTLKWLK
ncbi:hypothetical protein D9M68_789470 [compost metagenome]